jgi:hypothetical protein
MTNQSFIEQMETALIPECYKFLDSYENNIVERVFRGRDFIIARYMLAIAHIENIENLQTMVSEIRDEIKRKYMAIWAIREIGLQILLYGENILGGNEQIPSADKFGNHAVIIQGVHVVDTASNKVAFDQSKWGHLKFGAATKINEIINKNKNI